VALLIGDLVSVIVETEAMGAVMNLGVPFVIWLPVLAYFLIPASISVFLFWRLGIFSFRDHAWRSLMSLVLCVVMPAVAYASLYVMLMPGCWQYRLRGIACDW
jgi:hypothetical protein